MAGDTTQGTAAGPVGQCPWDDGAMRAWLNGEITDLDVPLIGLLDHGFTVGRLQFWYDMPSIGGKVYVNMTNNSNQWFLRFASKTGIPFMMNGRIIGVPMTGVPKGHWVEDRKTMLTILAKLFIYGAKQ